MHTVPTLKGSILTIFLDENFQLTQVRKTKQFLAEALKGFPLHNLKFKHEFIQI